MLVHGLDIRLPLGLTRDVAPERLRKSSTYLTGGSARGVVAGNTLSGLRFAADDLDWAHGSGPTVSGPAEALLLAITGRRAGLDRLSGDGVSTLRSLCTEPRPDDVVSVWACGPLPRRGGGSVVVGVHHGVPSAA